MNLKTKNLQKTFKLIQVFSNKHNNQETQKFPLYKEQCTTTFKDYTRAQLVVSE